MNTGIFTVYDSAAKRFLEPFTAPTVEFAIRSFREVVNRPDHQFNKFPEDYTLFHVGEFEPDAGTLVAYDGPRSLGVAISFVEHGGVTLETMRRPEEMVVDA